MFPRYYVPSDIPGMFKSSHNSVTFITKHLSVQSCYLLFFTRILLKEFVTITIPRRDEVKHPTLSFYYRFIVASFTLQCRYKLFQSCKISDVETLSIISYFFRDNTVSQLLEGFYSSSTL